jgi:hypothetical protein
LLAGIHAREDKESPMLGRTAGCGRREGGNGLTGTQHNDVEFPAGVAQSVSADPRRKYDKHKT